MLNLNRLAYFAAVVETGSFTRAAQRLGVTKAVVSQQVAQLEQDLRTSLLARTTRRVHPTEAGATLHARCVTILREAEDALDELALTNEEPTGCLRITATNDYGVTIVAPVIAAFTARYPNCRVELTLSDEKIDLVSGKLDMAIRVGWLLDSTAQARKIRAFDQLLVAAPVFAERLKSVRQPEDIEPLPFIANMALSEPLVWRYLRNDSEPRTARMRANISIDTTSGVRAAVLAGGGLSVLPDFLVAHDIAAGRLLHILPDWHLPSAAIHPVYPAARHRPPKVTAFVDMLIAADRQKGLEIAPV